MQPPGRDRVFQIAALIAVAVAYFSGAHHDYVAYLKHWDWIAAGNDPWALDRDMAYPGGVTYGPAYLALVPLYLLDPMLPKVLFVGFWLFGWHLLGLWPGRELGPGDERLRRWAYLLTPMIWVNVVYYGHFDVVCAVLTLIAVRQARFGSYRSAGIALALGFLLKIFPIALLPFIAVRRRRIRWSLIGTFTATAIAGLGLTYYAWGPSFFYSFAVAAERAPKLFSIFYYLESTYSFLRLLPGGGAEVSASSLSLPLLALSGGLWFLYWAWRDWDELTGVLVASLVICLWYKVGHLQYFVIPAVLLVAWWIDNDADRSSPGAISWRRPAKYYLIWFAATTPLYTWTGGFHARPWPIVREIGGLPTFVVGAWLIWALILQQNRSRSRDAQAEAFSSALFEKLPRRVRVRS